MSKESKQQQENELLEQTEVYIGTIMEYLQLIEKEKIFETKEKEYTQSQKRIINEIPSDLFLNGIYSLTIIHDYIKTHFNNLTKLRNAFQMKSNMIIQKQIRDCTNEMIEEKRQTIDFGKHSEIDEKYKKKVKQLESEMYSIEYEDDSISIVFNMLSMKESNLLEQWTGLMIGEIIFDSEINRWNQHDSEFDRILMGRNSIVIVIEDERGNVFGTFTSRQINDYYSHLHDPHSFVFNLRSNGRLSEPMSFPIKNKNEGLFLYPGDNHWLLSIGSDGGNNGLDDITIMKNDCQQRHPGNGCVQQSYHYNGIPNALCGDRRFDIKRFIVIQMV